MQFRRSPSARSLDADWHRERQRAREVAYNSSLDMFSAVEKTKYNLETAQIDGSDNPRLYTWQRTFDVLGINGTDIRDLRDH